MKLVIDHLRRLLDFSGREGRASFWPWTGVVFGLAMVAWAAVFIPFMAQTMSRMQSFAAEHPESATITQGPGHYSITIEGNHPGLIPDFEPLFAALALIMLFSVVLLAASVTRRLHDRGLRGYWGLMPLPFVGFAFWTMPKLFTAREPDITAFLGLFANNLAYLVCLGTLVLLLCKRSDPADNRFGPAMGV